MEKEIQSFITYLHNIKKTSQNTELSYQRDLTKFSRYAEENGISDIAEIYDRFGTPEEIASQALSTVDPKKIKKALSIKRVFAIALTALVVSFIVFLVAMYMDAHKDNHGTIEETMIVLEAYTLDEEKGDEE